MKVLFALEDIFIVEILCNILRHSIFSGITSLQSLLLFVKETKLLEVVAKRIQTEIFKCCPKVNWVSVAVAKINPPIGGDVEKVVIRLEQGRK